MTGRTQEGFGLGAAHMPDHGRLAGAYEPARERKRRLAARTCERHAENAADLAEMLAMLGLDPREGR